MVWEWNWPHKLGGAPSFSFAVDVNREGDDHAPGFFVTLQVGAWMLLDFGFYNRHHADCEEGCEQ